ncbi:MAG: serine hydrolase [Fimbriimonas sp.]|nr:serine hydrolase [Fimbriimonas sp.]
MSRRMNQQGFFSLMLATLVSLVTAQAPTEKLDKIVAKYDTKTAPGVEILVVQDGKELYRRTAGMANVEYGIPITKDSIFHIASVSKQFTAFAACLLEQEGKLNLDDDVRNYLPELPNYGTKITLRNLATHTSGLRDFYALNAMVGFTEADVSYNSQILQLLFQQKNLNFKPGTKFEYGNSSFTLLGEIVSRVAKKPLTEFLKERVFAPLGMTQTQLVNDPEFIIPNRAYSYYTQGGVLYKRLLGPVNVGSTGINSTADDLVRWSQNFENPKVGNQKLFQRMSERNKNSGGYALGQEFKSYRGVKIVFHGGGDAGYRSYLIRVPDEKLTVVVLGNSREFFPVDLAYGALDAFLFNGPAPEKPKPNFDPKLLTKFVGDYEIFPGNIVRLTTEKGKLYLQPLGDPNKMELPQVGNYEFDYPVFTHSRFTFGKSGNFKWQLFDIPYGGTRVHLKPFKPAQANLKELIGTYYSPELRDEYTLSVVKGQLIASHRRNEDTTLMPIQRDWYHGSSYFFGKVIPTRDGKGRITGLRGSTQGASNILFKRVPARRPLLLTAW